MSPRRSAALLLAFGLLAAALPEAHAGTFTIDPIQLTLGRERPSALLTLSNPTDTPVRLELRAFRWTQTPDDPLRLDPTTELLVFPRLLTLRPGESRLVRVGTLRPPGPAEQAYRLFIEELPPPPEATPGEIRVLLRVGLPVFVVPPAGGRAALTLTPAPAPPGRIAFELHNPGPVHLAPHSLRIEGLGPGAEPLWTHTVAGWYLLAGARQRYELTPDPAVCPHLQTVLVTVEPAPAPARYALPPPACRP